MSSHHVIGLIELTVPAADFDDRNVLAFKRERPKSHTWMNIFDMLESSVIYEREENRTCWIQQ